MRSVQNIVWQHAAVTRQRRYVLNRHRSCVLWFTGLSGAGKSTLAHAVEEELFRSGCRTFVLDGDNVRHGLSSDLGFSEADRKENIRRIGETAKLMMEAGIITITALISPFAEDRNAVRRLLSEGDFVEIHCKASLKTCEARDVKGFYKKARAGEIKNYTGISSPYEPPEHPELVVDTDQNHLDACVWMVMKLLADRGIIEVAADPMISDAAGRRRPSRGSARMFVLHQSRTELGCEELRVLEERVGRLHVRQRLGAEKDHEAQVFGQGLNFFHIENSALSSRVIEYALKVTGLFWRGRRNAEQIEVRHNHVRVGGLPDAFDGFSILQLSDLHCDISQPAMQRVAALLPTQSYDVCVLTGDFRGATFGPFDDALATISTLRAAIRSPVYGVLGNHDTIRMVPSLEKMNIRMLVNESDTIKRGGQSIHIAGIDDAHFYRADNMEKATALIPLDAFSILLSHTPEIYRQAAYAGFDLLLSGHTHGGQICLPGGIPVTFHSILPRRLGAGPWKHHTIDGYTSVGAGSSVVPVRFNCRPEITLHHLAKMR